MISILMESGTSGEYKKRHHIIKEGEVSRSIYFIKSGVVRHYVITPNGLEKTIRISVENNFFYSSIVSFFKNEPSYIYCQCLTEVDYVTWSNSELETLMAKHPELMDFRNRQLINFILEKHNKEMSLLTKRAEERLIEFNRDHQELFNRIPHHVIASYLDLTPETLSRLRSKLLKRLDLDQCKYY